MSASNQIIKFSEIARIRNGYAFKSKDYVAKGVGLVRQSNLTGNLVDMDDAKYLPSEFLTKYPLFIVNKGDVLIGLSGSIGEPSIYEEDAPALQNQRTGLIIPVDDDPSNMFYVRYLLLFLTNELMGSSKGAGIQNLSAQDIENLPIPFHSQKERMLIVENLDESFSKIDEGISSLEITERQLELYRQSVLKDAFEGKLTADWRASNPDLVEPADTLLARIEAERKAAHQAELDAWKDAVNQWEVKGKDGKKPSKPKKPDLTPVIFEEGNSAIMPENWIKVQISSVLSPQSGSTPKGISNVANGAVNYIKVDDMNAVGNEIKIQNSKMMLNAKSIKDFSMNLLPEGTVIFPKRGGAIKTDKKRALSKPSCVDTNIMGLVNSSQSILNDFIYTFMKSFTLFQISDGSNVPQINNGSLKAVAFPICSPEEQQEVCRIIGEKFERIDNLKTSISFSFSHSNALRQSILKQAFSGHELLEDAS